MSANGVEIHSSRMRRVLKRIGRILLYCVLAVIALSIGLRVYSARQIPKAKRLLCDVSRLQPGQRLDENAVHVLKTHQFTSIWPCTADSCFYTAGEFSWWTKEAFWIASYGGQYLGVRPWRAEVSLTIRNGSIEEIRSEVAFLGEHSLVGGELNGKTHMRFAYESSPDFRIWEYPRYRDQLPQLDYTSLAARQDIDAAFEASFLCIWKFVPCTSGYEVFPQWRDLSRRIEDDERAWESVADPCPSARMYAQVRDSDQIAIGDVTLDGPVETAVHIDKMLRDTTQFPSVMRTRFPRTKIDHRIFGDRFAVGMKVILTSSLDCNPLPASEANLKAMNDALLRFPPKERDPREFYSITFGPQIITIPPPPLPAALRSQN